MKWLLRIAAVVIVALVIWKVWQRVFVTDETSALYCRSRLGRCRHPPMAPPTAPRRASSRFAGTYVESGLGLATG